MKNKKALSAALIIAATAAGIALARVKLGAAVFEDFFDWFWDIFRYISFHQR
ncbi:MAG: hypothetical protein L0Y50_11405 [Beijerinckiaceae bacterium]|nr:hypothetical protein [Beijerinckiaceae bacterium]MCI0736855.1 hypothetical protein [Beijerinckiaceae bacterium]